MDTDGWTCCHAERHTVPESPRPFPRIWSQTRTERFVQLIFKLNQLLPGHRTPFVFGQYGWLLPELLDEVSADAQSSAFVASFMPAYFQRETTSHLRKIRFWEIILSKSKQI